MTARPAWQTQWIANDGECPCRWDLYSASCPRPWHRELADFDPKYTVDLPSAPDFTPHDWMAIS